jgi:transcription factor SPN1
LICEWRAATCSESDDEGDRAGPRPDDEAEEEDDELETIFKGQKNKRRRGSHVENIKAGVEELLAHMEVAAERDMEAIKEGRPAFLKFKMLKEVSKTPFRSVEEEKVAMAASKGLLADL